MEKFFVDTEQLIGGNIHIGNEDAKHIKKVLRKKVGDNICITVNQSQTFLCEIKELNDESVVCNILDEIIENNETKIDITLFQCIAKYDKMDDIVQKATQLGVKEIYPVVSNRVVVKLDDETKIKKVERWSKIAQEASKQSRRTVIPRVENVIFLTNICNYLSKYDIILLAYENDKTNLKEILQGCNDEKVKTIGVIIGPEGGFDMEEVDSLLSYDNICSVSLGNRILRTETASIFLISNILYEFGEL